MRILIALAPLAAIMAFAAPAAGQDGPTQLTPLQVQGRLAPQGRGSRQ